MDNNRHSFTIRVITISLMFFITLLLQVNAQPKLYKADAEKGKPGKEIQVTLHGRGFEEIKRIDEVKIGGLTTELLKYEIESDKLMQLDIVLPTDLDTGFHGISLRVYGIDFESRIETPSSRGISPTSSRDNAPEIEVLYNEQAITNGQPQPIVFDTAQIGFPVVAEFAINNRGGATLSLDSLQLPDGFSLLGIFPDEIGGGNSAFFYIRLQADRIGDFSGMLQFKTNDEDENPFNFSVNAVVASAPTPPIALSDGEVIFRPGEANMIEFETSDTDSPTTKELMIKNTSKTRLTLSDFQLPDGFRLVDNFPDLIEPADSSAISIEFVPDSATTYSGLFQFRSNLSGENEIVFPLLGRVTAPTLPQIELSDGAISYQPSQPSAIEISASAAGEPVSKTLSITNSDTATLDLSDLQLPVGFRLISSFPKNIAPGDTATFTIQLATDSVATYSGLMQFYSNLNEVNPFVFPIIGRVKAIPKPGIEVSDGIASFKPGEDLVIDFGSTVVGSPLDKTLTVTNKGANPINLNNLLLPVGFGLVTPYPQLVNPGTSENITVQFKADSAKTFAGIMRIPNSGDEDAPFLFQLSALATEPSPTANPWWWILPIVALVGLVALTVGKPLLLKGIAYLKSIAVKGTTTSPGTVFHFKPQRDFGRQHVKASQPIRSSFELRLKPVLDYGQQMIRVAGSLIQEDKATVQVTPESSVHAGKPKSVPHDDLTRIEGIGPKISVLMLSAGIRTFGQLAATDVKQLEEILNKAEIWMADPATWPEQARLAAAGKWQALNEWQEKLKGGRIQAENL